MASSSEPPSFQLNDDVFVNASAWKSSTYKKHWPYDDPMDICYFQATVTTNRDSGVSLTFAAFEMERGKNYYHSAWLRRYVTRELPEGSKLITRDDYETREVRGGNGHSKIDASDQDDDDVYNPSDDGDSSGAEHVLNAKRLRNGRKRTLRSHRRGNKKL